MIKFLASPDDVLAAKIDKTVDRRDLQQFTNRLDEMLDQHASIALYLDVRGLKRLSMAALLDDLSYSLRRFRDLQNIRRMALVTGTGWIQTVANWESRLLPGINLRVFEAEERTAALDWASEAVPEPPPSVHRIRTTHDSVRAFLLDGPIRGEDVRLIADDLDAAYARHGSIRMLVRINTYSLRASAFTENLLRLKLDAIQHVKKYAVVGGPDWVKNMISVMDPIMTIDMRHFNAEEEDAAWAWIGAEKITGTPETAPA